MADDIWSGNEPFLKDNSSKIPKKNYIFAAVLVIVVAVIILTIFPRQETTELTGKVVDDLRDYRDMSAEELLEQLNQEKGLIGKIHEINMTAGSYYFEPNEIKAKVGDKIRITITAVDDDHQIIIPRFFISETLERKKPKKIEFVVNRAGSFIFKSKENDNMVGKIIVEEKSSS